MVDEDEEEEDNEGVDAMGREEEGRDGPRRTDGAEEDVEARAEASRGRTVFVASLIRVVKGLSSRIELRGHMYCVLRCCVACV